ncbi:MAG TPA: beta-ketoacyl-[acyl-carrier-protein] synthase family protein [Pyrinomonadaceae bacterium]|nr:beta-ketoacyl-[acyl-carrier-protein] synthase family protein [Pyrinomonadaceae bacterium]
MTRRVVVTGAGLVSPLGDSPAALHAALCEGRGGVKPLELFGAGGARCTLAGEVSGFDAQKYLGRRNLRPLDRTGRLAASAAQLALDDAGWTPELRGSREVGLVLGTMFGGLHTISEFDRRAVEAGPAYASPMDFANTVINAAAGQAAIIHGLRGVNSTVSAGAASGLQAVAYAADLIRRGRARSLVAGGAEELCFESFYGFDRARVLCGSGGDGEGEYPVPFDARRNGFAQAEGAALLVLEESESARGRGARVLAEVEGYGCAFDASLGENEESAVGAIARAIGSALEDASVRPEEVDCLSASANGGVSGDRREARAVASVFGGRARELPVTAVKSALGEALGASGALQAVAMLGTMRDGVLPGVRNFERGDDGFPLASVSPAGRRVEVRRAVISSVGFDGHCCALLLARPASQ